MRKLTLAAAAAAVVGLFAGGPAMAQGSPASQAAFAFGELNILTESMTLQVEDPANVVGDDPGLIGDGNCDPGEDCISSGPADDHLAQTILKKWIKAPKNKDLYMNVSLECGNFGQTKVKSKGGNKDTSIAGSVVRVRVKVTDDQNNVRYASPTGNSERTLHSVFNVDPVSARLGVVYCKAVQELSATFQGLFQTGDEFEIEDPDNAVGDDEELIGDGNCDPGEDCITVVGTCLIEDPLTGNIVLILDCLEPEEVELVLDQMTAASFNFILANIEDSGVQTVEVEAILDTGTNAQEGSATARATIGLGSMIIQTIRLVKDDDGSTIALE